jgi:hypothetical protein
MLHSETRSGPGHHLATNRDASDVADPRLGPLLGLYVPFGGGTSATLLKRLGPSGASPYQKFANR